MAELPHEPVGGWLAGALLHLRLLDHQLAVDHGRHEVHLAGRRVPHKRSHGYHGRVLLLRAQLDRSGRSRLLQILGVGVEGGVLLGGAHNVALLRRQLLEVLLVRLPVVDGARLRLRLVLGGVVALAPVADNLLQLLVVGEGNAALLFTTLVSPTVLENSRFSWEIDVNKADVGI